LSFRVLLTALKMLEKATKTKKQHKEKATALDRAWHNHPIGYPRLAERVALKPATGIYRRFDALNSRHILYLQAELCILEKELHGLEHQDRKNPNGTRSKFAIDYQRMLETPVDEDQRQLELIGTMHKKLDLYSKLCLAAESIY
jgi:hypothetical protein